LGVSFPNPNFAEYAKKLGGEGYRITNPKELDKELLIEFRDHIKDNMIQPVRNQECARWNNSLWTADLWTLGVIDKLLNHNPEEYSTEDPKEQMPNISGTMDYHLWYSSRWKIHMFEELQKIKDESDTILIGEIGRGLDLLIANMVKKWNHVLAYDQSKHNGKYLFRYFKDVEYSVTNTFTYLTSENFIKRDCILLINNTSFRQWEKINKHIKYVIWNGKQEQGVFGTPNNEI